jgi:cytochrome c oxidase subunit IV
MIYPPRTLLLSWAALVALLALTVLLSYQPLGAFNTPIALMIAALKAAIVAIIFMELCESRALVIAFALAGFFWLAILLWLAGADYLTRSPPTIPIT